MALTLKQMKLVITGTFEGIDSEDLHWDLIAMGAFVKKSVTKTTAALIAGDAPELKHLKAAKKHGTPVIYRAGLDALLEGASLDVVIAGDYDSSTELSDLSGWKIAISGGFDNRTQASIRSALESQGARVVNSASRSCDLLVLGEDYSFAAIEAMDEGVPFIGPDELSNLLTGTSVSEFVASPVDVDDRAAALEQKVNELVSQICRSLGSGASMDTEITVTVSARGRATVKLSEYEGTSLQKMARWHAQRIAWPTGEADTTLSRKIVVR